MALRNLKIEEDTEGSWILEVNEDGLYDITVLRPLERYQIVSLYAALENVLALTERG